MHRYDVVAANFPLRDRLTKHYWWDCKRIDIPSDWAERERMYFPIFRCVQSDVSLNSSYISGDI